ncbi:hypothetical protein RJ640_009387 [Escallonia rubra]|uniref:Uncharacterized protein n=1 Tax=Escallonia rubra TaxID=112253 RepID=A0AA88QG05_9ASTE|nr:hypothetical protein RJ640_009387 [Escallonia rubra]
MNANNLLEFALRDILNVINPSRDDWSIRFRIIEELRDDIQSIESLRGFRQRPRSLLQWLGQRCTANYVTGTLLRQGPLLSGNGDPRIVHEDAI